MSVHSVVVEFDDQTLDREAFLDVFKTHVCPYLDNEVNLRFALRGIVLNFYDHAYGKGIIKLLIDGAHIEYEAHDFGPGYREESCTSLLEAKNHTVQVGSSKETGHTAGIGLTMIYANLKGIKEDHPDSVWDVSIQGRFHYKGSYTSQAI